MSRKGTIVVSIVVLVSMVLPALVLWLGYHFAEQMGWLSDWLKFIDQEHARQAIAVCASVMICILVHRLVGLIIEAPKLDSLRAYQRKGYLAVFLMACSATLLVLLATVIGASVNALAIPFEVLVVSVVSGAIQVFLMMTVLRNLMLKK